MASDKLTYSILKQLLENENVLPVLEVGFCIPDPDNIDKISYEIHEFKQHSNTDIIDVINHNNITLDPNSKIINIRIKENSCESNKIFVFDNENLSYLFEIDNHNLSTKYSVYNFVDYDKTLYETKLGCKYSNFISYYFDDEVKNIIGRSLLKNDKLIQFYLLSNCDEQEPNNDYLLLTFVILNYENGRLIKKIYNEQLKKYVSDEEILNNIEKIMDENFINEHYNINFIRIKNNKISKEFTFCESCYGYGKYVHIKEEHPITVGGIFRYHTKCKYLLVYKEYKNGKLTTKEYTKKYLEYYGKQIKHNNLDNKHYTETTTIVIDSDNCEFERIYKKTGLIEKGIYKDDIKISELYLNDTLIMELDFNKKNIDFTDYFNKVYNKNVNFKITDNEYCCSIEIIDLDKNIHCNIDLYDFRKKSIELLNEKEKLDIAWYINEIKYFLEF